MEKFKLGFMVGRMQPIHKGHQILIDKGLEMCEKFVVLLGSSNVSREGENPFTFEERKEMIKAIYGNRVEVYPIVNIGIGYTPEWGNYLVNTIKFYTGETPDFTIGGVEEDRNNYLNNYPEITRFIISRNLIKINSTKIREIFEEYSVDELRNEYPEYKVEKIREAKATLNQALDSKIKSILIKLLPEIYQQ